MDSVQILVTRMRGEDERATIYAEGGIEYSTYVPGIGWVLTDSPSAHVEAVAAKTRAAAFPALVPHD